MPDLAGIKTSNKA